MVKINLSTILKAQNKAFNKYQTEIEQILNTAHENAFNHGFHSGMMFILDLLENKIEMVKNVKE